MASHILSRYSRRARAVVDDAILGIYLSGANTRRIKGALRPLLRGAPLSRSSISRIVVRDAMAKTLGLSLQPPAQDAPGFEIGFKVPDVDAAFAELVARGASPVTPPTNRPWGQRTAYIRDPDGHLIELAQDLGRS